LGDDLFVTVGYTNRKGVSLESISDHVDESPLVPALKLNQN
jgi:hypothetical protein